MESHCCHLCGKPTTVLDYVAVRAGPQSARRTVKVAFNFRDAGDASLLICAACRLEILQSILTETCRGVHEPLNPTDTADKNAVLTRPILNPDAADLTYYSVANDGTEFRIFWSVGNRFVVMRRLKVERCFRRPANSDLHVTIDAAVEQMKLFVKIANDVHAEQSILWVPVAETKDVSS